MDDERTEPDCPLCRDSGWVLHECDGSRLCGRRKRHAEHTFVVACTCRPMNRNFQDRLAGYQQAS